MTSDVANTVKYDRSSMDSIFCVEEGDAGVDPADEKNDFRAFGVVLAFVVGEEPSFSVSFDVNNSSGTSFTAESTRRLTVCCSSGRTSFGFHCSSSTSFAD